MRQEQEARYWIYACVNSDHTGDQYTCRSSNGFLIDLNTVLISWYSKRQSTIEIGTFGAEFVAMKRGIDILQQISYELLMMGIPIDGVTRIYGDGISVINNTSTP